MKLKNKINERTGRFICNRCDEDINLGIMVRRLVYCLKCGGIIKGVRNERGMIKERVK